jgi:hypothetical protein
MMPTVNPNKILEACNDKLEQSLSKHNTLEMDKLIKSFKGCVEATGHDLDGNNDDIDWLIRNGASEVKVCADERDALQIEVDNLLKANKRMEQALRQIKELSRPEQIFTPSELIDVIADILDISREAIAKAEGR